jgi:hypothetical protein
MMGRQTVDQSQLFYFFNGDGFGLGDRLPQRSDLRLQLRNLLGRFLGLLPPSLSQDLGFGNRLLQRSYMELQDVDPKWFVGTRMSVSHFFCFEICVMRACRASARSGEVTRTSPAP